MQDCDKTKAELSDTTCRMFQNLYFTQISRNISLNTTVATCWIPLFITFLKPVHQWIQSAVPIHVINLL